MVAGDAGRQEDGPRLPQLPLLAVELEASLLPVDRGDAAEDDLGSARLRLGFQLLLDRDPGRLGHPGDVVELLQGIEEGAGGPVDEQHRPVLPGEVEGGGEAGRAAAHDHRIVELHAKRLRLAAE